jgi:two-component sensor histidine kinase
MSSDLMIIGSDSKEGIDGIFQAFGQQHLCNIYRDRHEQFFLIADFILDGLRKKDKCIYIVDENTKEGVLGAFKEMRDLADDSILERLIFLTKEDSYLKGGSFDPELMIGLLRETQEKAVAEGFPALRVTGEMTWIFSKLPGVEKLLEYEAKLNYFFPKSKSTAICQYNENRFDSKTLMGVLNTHPVVGIYGKLHENPYYIPPDVYLASLKGEVPLALYETAKEDIISRSDIERGRRRAEIALTQSHEKLKTLSSLNRHDMGNQLLVIMGCSALARERNLDPEMKKLIESIIKASTTMNQQLEFAKTYQELGTTEPKWIDVKSSLESVIVGMNIGGISFVNDVANLKVLADPMFERVFYNLIDNSIRHGEKVMNIRISTKIYSGNLGILYEDDGVGVRNEYKGRIFEKGFGKNTGLGLYLCREILALTGASIKENGTFNSGVRFEIIFPPQNWIQN